MPYFYLCPHCAARVNQFFVNCPNCHSRISPIQSENERQYYYEESIKLYNDSSKWEKLLIEELKNNPLYIGDKVKSTNYQEEYNKEVNRLFQHNQQKQQLNVPKCPTCNSTNISKIGGLNRALHGYAFGLFSKTARSQFECKNCGYKW